jgi:hypothetical protein
MVEGPGEDRHAHKRGGRPRADAIDSGNPRRRAGLEIESDEYVPEGNPDDDVGHQLFWARRET